MSVDFKTRSGMLATHESENCKIPGALDILRKVMANSDESSIHMSENIVQKREKILSCGSEITVRRIYVLYGSYRVLDADVNFCMECEAEFTFFKRKHHCRACGSVVCGTCSPYQARISAIEEPGGSRVCVNCFGLKVNVSVMKPFDADASPNGSVDYTMSDDRGLESQLSSGEIMSNIEGSGKEPSLDEKERRREKQRRELREQAKLRMAEAAKIPQYQRAYRTMRCIVPPDVAETSIQKMLDDGLPSPVARRVWQCRCLWLLSMHNDDIKKIHIADLRSKYAPVGLDLVEMRAVWHVLPDWTDDKDSEKAEWKLNFKYQMDDLAAREESTSDGECLKRHAAYEGYEPLRVYSSNAPIRRRYSCSDTSTVQSVVESDISSQGPPRRATDGALSASCSFTTPSKTQKEHSADRTDGSRQPLFTPSPSTPRRHSFSSASKDSATTPSPPPGHSPPVSLFLYRRATGDLAASEQQSQEVDLAPPLQRRDGLWPRRLKSFFLGENVAETDDPLDATPEKSGVKRDSDKTMQLAVQTHDELEKNATLSRPRSLAEMPTSRRPRHSEASEAGRSKSCSPPVRSQSMSAVAIGSETSSYRQRRQMERMKHKLCGESGDYSSDGGSASGYSSPSMSPVPNGGAKRLAALRNGGDHSRMRSISDSGPHIANYDSNSGRGTRVSRKQEEAKGKSKGSNCAAGTSGSAALPGAPTASSTAFRLFPCAGDENQSNPTDAEDNSAAGTIDNNTTPTHDDSKPRRTYSRQSTASSDGGDNCTPVANRVPFFFTTPDVSTTHRHPMALSDHSTSGASTPTTPNLQESTRRSPEHFRTPPSVMRGTSSTATTALFLASNAAAGVVMSPAVDRSEFPTLAATPVREMMGSVAAVEVARVLQASKLTMTADEATDLLKYALVNYCDVDGGAWSSQRVEEEECGIIATIDMLVERAHANVNAVDRDGNSLLTFVMVYSQSEDHVDEEDSVGDRRGETGGVRSGIRKLIRCLVFHGINIFVSLDHMDCLHAALLFLEKDDMEWLTEMFRLHCSITSAGTVDPKKIDLSDAQYWNFFAVLVLTGQVEAAAFLLEMQKVFLSPAQASALMKGCRFESMESPIDTYELLEHHGGQV